MSNINSVWMNCTIAWFFVTFIFTSKKLYKSSTLNHGNVFKKKSNGTFYECFIQYAIRAIAREIIAQSGLFGVDQLPRCLYIDNMHTVYWQFTEPYLTKDCKSRFYFDFHEMKESRTFMIRNC